MWFVSLKQIVPGVAHVCQHHIDSLTRSWCVSVSAWDSASLKKPECQCARGRNYLHLVCPSVRCVAAPTYLFVKPEFSSDCIHAKQILTRGTNGISSSRICLCLTCRRNQWGKEQRRASCCGLPLCILLSKSEF